MLATSEKNREVFLNFGLIAYGPLREIEKLQQILAQECAELKLVYQTVSAKRLFLLKKSAVTDRAEGRHDDAGTRQDVPVSES
jgi:hypothetical protein